MPKRVKRFLDRKRVKDYTFSVFRPAMTSPKSNRISASGFLTSTLGASLAAGLTAALTGPFRATFTTFAGAAFIVFFALINVLSFPFSLAFGAVFVAALRPKRRPPICGAALCGEAQPFPGPILQYRGLVVVVGRPVVSSSLFSPCAVCLFAFFLFALRCLVLLAALARGSEGERVREIRVVFEECSRLAKRHAPSLMIQEVRRDRTRLVIWVPSRHRQE